MAFLALIPLVVEGGIELGGALLASEEVAAAVAATSEAATAAATTVWEALPEAFAAGEEGGLAVLEGAESTAVQEFAANEAIAEFGPRFVRK